MSDALQNDELVRILTNTPSDAYEWIRSIDKFCESSGGVWERRWHELGIRIGLAFGEVALLRWQTEHPNDAAASLLVQSAADWVACPCAEHAEACRAAVDRGEGEWNHLAATLPRAVALDMIYADTLGELARFCFAHADKVSLMTAVRERVLPWVLRVAAESSADAPRRGGDAALGAHRQWSSPTPSVVQHAATKILTEAYRVTFPPDLFAFWDFVRCLNPDRPLDALDEALGIRLVGPFELLAGGLPAEAAGSLFLHWRYHADPPELFTVWSGNTDGLHWGYVYDDPAAVAACVAYNYARDSAENRITGANLFQALRAKIDAELESLRSSRHHDPEFYDAAIANVQTIVALLDAHEPARSYAPGYHRHAWEERQRTVSAETLDGLGVVCSPDALGSLVSGHGAVRGGDLDALERDVMAQLAAGCPGAALQFGRDLWSWSEKERSVRARRILEAAYRALGRPLLAEILDVHFRERDRPSLSCFA